MPPPSHIFFVSLSLSLANPCSLSLTLSLSHSTVSPISNLSPLSVSSSISLSVFLSASVPPSLCHTHTVSLIFLVFCLLHTFSLVSHIHFLSLSNFSHTLTGKHNFTAPYPPSCPRCQTCRGRQASSAKTGLEDDM